MPPGAEADAALLLGLERAKLRGLPSGVELERFSRRPLAEDERLALWRRWLVEQPRGWDESGRPGSSAYRDEELVPFRAGGPVFLYVGRQIFLAGWRPHEELPQALNAADALVLPSEALLSAANGEEERRARGRRAQTDSRRYGWAEIARRFASLYEELLASAPRRQVARGRRA